MSWKPDKSRVLDKAMQLLFELRLCCGCKHICSNLLRLTDPWLSNTEACRFLHILELVGWKQGSRKDLGGLVQGQNSRKGKLPWIVPLPQQQVMVELPFLVMSLLCRSDCSIFLSFRPVHKARALGDECPDYQPPTISSRAFLSPSPTSPDS